jgi:hypothetical protein
MSLWSVVVVIDIVKSSMFEQFDVREGGGGMELGDGWLTRMNALLCAGI